MKKIFLSLVMAVGFMSLAHAADKPSFPGGEAALKKYIAENTKYPQVAKDNGVEGVVEVQFLVKTDGSINNVKVVRFVDPDLETEATRVVKGMPAWIPADNNGSPIDATTVVDIPFVLD